MRTFLTLTFTCLILITLAIGQSAFPQHNILIIGAHPDDAEKAGGLASQYAANGHTVKLISMTNGDAGHHQIGGRQLALRRQEESRQSGRVIGAEYVLLNHHDGELEPKMEIRKQLIEMMREFQPDLIITHRVYDYHPDHRYTGQLVIDAYTELSVPGNVSLIPYLKKFPVLAYMSDGFEKPYPFSPQIVIDITETIEKKIDMYHCHVSQMYEWLPFIRGTYHQVPNTADERRAWLAMTIKNEARNIADKYRSVLSERYGEKRAATIQFAEAYEISEYTLHLTKEHLQQLIPF